MGVRDLLGRVMRRRRTSTMLEDAIARARTVGVPEEKVREAYVAAPDAAWFRSWVAYLGLFKQAPEWRG